MMALSSAIALLVFAALLLSAAAAPAVAPAPVIGQPGCNTTCGGVRVPYPFGLGPEHCSWPGFNLTCDTTGRLLLGDGTLRVDHIFLGNTSVRVVRTGSIINESTGNSTSDGWSFPFGTSFAGSVYELHTNNELVLFGCSLAVTLVESAAAGESNPKISAGCFSICASSFVYSASKDKLCSNVGCCQVNIVLVGRPNAVQLRSSSLSTAGPTLKSPLVFIAEKGWFDRNGKRNKAGIPVRPKRPAVLRVPFMLSWGAPPGNAGLPKRNSGEEVCPGNTSRVLCKSDHSKCRSYSRGYVCYCMDGYNGNPYLAGGCQVHQLAPSPDIDECKKPREQIRCFGDCINMNGTYKCRCPKGTRGNHSLPGGCIPIPADPVLVKPPSEGVVIGIAVGSGVGSILLVLIVVLITQRFKYLREKNMKQKYFKQNRGQLLQQLVSQNACIAERMIIPMDELAKATNNFDKARELGGGGHGMVYKGILSNQHVVAIKKSKITVQREIDEFINEVAILSQINHRNVVKLFGCCLETEVPLLVYEFISNGTLYQHLHVEGPRSLPWGSRLRIAVETSSALAYLHSSVSTPIIHRDIKSSNILLDDTLTSKVSDFGASRYIPIEKAGLTTRVQGTIGYLDPMCFYTGRLTEKSDVYSFGVMLVELLTRKKPFSYLSLDDEGLVSHFVNLLQQDNLVQLLDPQVVEEGGKEVQEIAILAASCIKLTSEDRPRMQQVELVLKGIAARIIEENGTAVMNCWTTTEEGQRSKESSRRYSMEKEFLLSASYPR
ncbi:hypothetical protein ACP70R_044661 [Stipagrostis hirtigluma subsp. patula]